MDKFRVKRGQKGNMAKISYAQMTGIKAVLESWWGIKGLPWAFLQQLETVAQVIATNSDTFEKMRKKFIDDYAAKDTDGAPVINDGVVVLADAELADDEWAKVVAVKFDCPVLRSCDMEANAEKLGLTLGTMRIIKPIVEDVIMES